MPAPLLSMILAFSWGGILTPLLAAVLAFAGFLHWRRTRQVYLLLLSLAAVLVLGGSTADPLLRELNVAENPAFPYLLRLGIALNLLGLFFGLLGGGAAIVAYFKTSRRRPGQGNDGATSGIDPT